MDVPLSWTIAKPFSDWVSAGASGLGGGTSVHAIAGVLGSEEVRYASVSGEAPVEAHSPDLNRLERRHPVDVAPVPVVGSPPQSGDDLGPEPRGRSDEAVELEPSWWVSTVIFLGAPVWLLVSRPPRCSDVIQVTSASWRTPTWYSFASEAA